MRDKGFYWFFGYKCCPESKMWSIYYWDGYYFWNSGDDFSEDNFDEIDERKIVRLA